jgi:hypothetical protein
MTHRELDEIEAKLRKVERLLPGDYGLVTALELARELRRLLPKPEAQEEVGAFQTQLVASAAPA